MSQKHVWLETEGDRWLERNRDVINNRSETDDPVMETLGLLKIEPKQILEVGCSNGWRLQLLEAYYDDVHVSGLDPSARAVDEAHIAALDVWQGTAEDLSHLPDHIIDLVIYSWVLCVVDREDLARVVAEADRVLTKGGHLLLYEPCTEIRYRNPWRHDTRLWCYKQNYATLWQNFGYTLFYHRLYGIEHLDKREAVSVLWKDA